MMITSTPHASSHLAESPVPSLVFFFQAEDGIRDHCVTGVQTCALPIYAWSTGLRRDGGPARAGTAKVEPDPSNGGIVKLNPLADWTREQVWAYAQANQVPIHPLYEQGYTSIGCAPCTRGVLPGEDERGGRWWWEAGPDKECGLHHASPSARF